jgi:DNA-binding transcriptional MerR regulator
MFKIGEFARFTHTSVKTLRFYDRIDLLKPNYTDPANGYRYYGLDQVEMLQRILALKAMGLSLDEIMRFLDPALPEAAVTELLLQRRTELETQFRQIREQLTRLNAHLRRLEKERTMPDYTITLIAPEQRTNADVPPGVQAIIHISTEEARLDEQKNRLLLIDADAAPQWLLSTIHRGALQTLAPAFRAVSAWMQGNGYRPVGPPREILREGATLQAEDAVIELQIPVTSNR